MSFNQEFLNLAISEAQKALSHGEVPIGAVVVRNGKVVSKAFNRREKTQNALNHAEMLAINRACKRLKSWRLDDCEMYVTLEPCQMCLGAITNARLKTVYVGARSTTDLNWKPSLEFLESAQCSDMLKKFFSDKRQKT